MVRLFIGCEHDAFLVMAFFLAFYRSYIIAGEQGLQSKIDFRAKHKALFSRGDINWIDK